MDSMFSAVLRIGLIITLFILVNLLSMIFRKEEHKIVKVAAILTVLLTMATGFIFFIVLFQ